VPLGRLAQVDGEDAVEDHEELFLPQVAVALAAGARGIAPNVRPRVGERIREARARPRVVIAARGEGELRCLEDREAHAESVITRLRFRA
jgi:hypothetical protein